MFGLSTLLLPLSPLCAFSFLCASFFFLGSALPEHFPFQSSVFSPDLLFFIPLRSSHSPPLTWTPARLSLHLSFFASFYSRRLKIVRDVLGGLWL